MQAFCHGVARFSSRKPWRAAGIPLRTAPARPISLRLSPKVNTQHRSLSSISNCSGTSEEDRHSSGGPQSTIYALSTATGRAAIAAIRISGPACTEIYRALCPSRPLPKPRYATLRALYNPLHPPTKDSVLDSSAIVLYFPAPKSVTGDDVLELHVHGGPAIVKAVLSAISRCTLSEKSHSIRYAEPGEFTRRAFMNNRLDLMQVEALGDTLSATTEQQRRLSVRGTTSGLGKRYETWRRQLLYARGELEALIDFSEDQHFDESPTQLVASVSTQVSQLRRQIKAHSANAVRGELLRNGIDISLLGAPNAGKSSLLNLVAGREAAIVSSEAGTTRDIVEIGLDIGGWYCKLGDMAGLRSGTTAGIISEFQATTTESDAAVGGVEREGIRRAKQRAQDSDILIIVLSIEPHPSGSGYHLPIDPSVQHTVIQALAGSPKGALVVVNKTDVVSPDNSIPHAYIPVILSAFPSLHSHEIFPTSCSRAIGAEGSDSGGVQAFLQGLVRKFEEITAPISLDGDADPSIWQEALGATERQRGLLNECLRYLDEFVDVVSSAHPQACDSGEGGDVDIVLAAESLRSAAECLARITGRGEAGDVEEVLGVVFEK